MSYLESHAISPAIAQACGVTGIMGGPIYFPYRYSFTRRRTKDGKMIQPKGQPLALYWPTGKQQAHTVLLVEGEGDCLAAASILCEPSGPSDEVKGLEPREDIPDILKGMVPIGLPGATTPTRVIVGELIAANTKQAWVCLDADRAGRAATDRICAALSAYQIDPIPVSLPEQQDLAETLAALSPASRTDWLANLIIDADERLTHKEKTIDRMKAGAGI